MLEPNEYRQVSQIIEILLENPRYVRTIQDTDSILHIVLDEDILVNPFYILLNSNGQSHFNEEPIWLSVDFIDRMRYNLKVWRLQNE